VVQTIELRGKDAWPALDVECRPRVLEEVAEAEQVTLRHFPDAAVRQSAAIIQAGGNCGLWPRMFARLGFTVHTFEPESTNFACLVQNCVEHLGGRIVPYMMALADEAGWGSFQVNPTNVGAHYLGGPGGERVRQTTIDSLVMPYERIDLIQLDVEGAEVIALQGASAVIGHHRPLLWLEDKGLTHKVSGHSSAESWLHERWPKYRVVERIRKDILLRWGG